MAKRKLNPRTCRGCGLVFAPKTSLSRYGNDACRALGKRFQTKAVPGAEITHPKAGAR